MSRQLLERLKNGISRNTDIEKTLLSSTPIEEKRQELQAYLASILSALFDHAKTIPPLEWILCRDAVWVFRSILSRRSEQLAGFSVLEYLDVLINDEDRSGYPELREGFVAEILHLIKGISGKAGIYSDEPPEFQNQEGQQAAVARSAYLSKMARSTTAAIERYSSGLSDHLIAERSINKQRLQASFAITDLEWNDWQWQVNNIIKEVDALRELVELSEAEHEAIIQARENRIPFGITPYYLSLFGDRQSRADDRAVRAQVLPPPDYVQKMRSNKVSGSCSMDFMLERDTTPIEGITRRYPNIVIFKPVLTCPQICVYCQRNWQIEDVFSSQALLPPDKVDQAIGWIEKTKEITEVLITGGDPLLLEDDPLDELLARVAAIPHVVRIRIGSRTLVTLPQRITDALVRRIARYHIPGQREIIMVTHFEHLTEITPETMAAVQKFRLFGLSVYNQLVYTYYNSRRFETAALRQQLRLIGVTPYYTFNTKGKEETDLYRVPIARLLQEQHEEARLLPGTVRTDEVVFNVPKLGKNYLRASEHRDLISILPDGKRVYEFHPWEKKLALIDTYVYTDVAIHDYLERLRLDGEDVEEYQTIWYYY